jgi:hypothetical protein
LLRAQALLPGKGEIRLFYPNNAATNQPDKSDVTDYII